ncbi:MAG: hypothetical protein ACKPKO_07940, partial [Candidatus Fonsibacter sp.]
KGGLLGKRITNPRSWVAHVLRFRAGLGGARFSVRCSAASELPHYGKWRHCVMWRIALPRFRALPETNKEEDIWQSGNLHVLGKSTRTPSKPELAVRIKPPATSFGDTLALVLDYDGPAIAAFKTLRSSRTQSGGPVKATLQVDGPAKSDPEQNTLKLLTAGIVELDLPIPLQISDAEQQDILSANGTYNAPVHVIPCLAGYGKPTMLQCMVAIYAAHHYRLSAAGRGAKVTLWELRHEFLQGLIHKAAFLQPEILMFGGLLAGSVCARR